MRKLVFAIVAIISCLIACSTEDPSSEMTRAKIQQLRFAIPQSPLSLDPAVATDLVYYQIVFNIFETLIAVDWQKETFTPVLATAWNSDSSGLRWTFKLRQGVVFHDGSALNAEAVKISFERQFDARSPYFHANVADTYGHFAFSMIEAIRAVDDSTVQFILKYPYSAFLDNLATPLFATVVSPAALKKSGAHFGRQPVGTGPFQFVSWEPERRIALKKFHHYWNKPAQLDSVFFQIIPGLETKLQMLQNGEMDVISGLSAASVNQLYRQKDVKVVAVAVLGTAVIGFNCQTYPFNDVKIRRAAAQALDNKSIVFSLSRGLSTVARGPLPFISTGYDSTLAAPPYDPTAAKMLLQSSGYRNGVAVKLGYISQTDTVRADPLSQAIQSYLEKIDLPVELVRYLDWQTYSDSVLAGGKAQLFREGLWVYTRHPDNFFYSHFHSQSLHNYFHYKNSEVDRLLEQARRTSEVSLQRQLYREVQEIILQDMPAVFHHRQIRPGEYHRCDHADYPQQ